MTSNWEKFLRIQQDIDLLLIDAVMAPDTAILGASDAETQRNDNAPADGDSRKDESLTLRLRVHLMATISASPCPRMATSPTSFPISA